MIKGIVTVTVVALIVLGVVLIAAFFRPRQRVPRNAGELCDRAARIMTQLRNPTDLDQVTVLPPQANEAIRRWLDDYRKEFKQ
ncbi:hypothetical protein GCM10027290_42120 [Micromonospora sonneratiae]|uniref:Uncharacterized protein n=1 Tax=Micromonospora sonneratiae TaxID=1184706 RepID=A0ABW3YBQ5_9ACTN